MIILFILLCLGALCFFFFGNIRKKDIKCANSFMYGLFCAFCIISAILCSIEMWCEKPITPIDVYRGNTTLEITYKDSVAIDSVVVWK